jgi:uncharacterized protein YggT (Ycf19 family)
MIFSVVILSLLSLLVATDPAPAGSSTPSMPEPPLRPLRKAGPDRHNQPEPERMAA